MTICVIDKSFTDLYTQWQNNISSKVPKTSYDQTTRNPETKLLSILTLLLLTTKPFTIYFPLIANIGMINSYKLHWCKLLVINFLVRERGRDSVIKGKALALWKCRMITIGFLEVRQAKLLWYNNANRGPVVPMMWDKLEHHFFTNQPDVGWWPAIRLVCPGWKLRNVCFDTF